MKKKSLLLVLMAAFMGLCQVQFLKAPGWGSFGRSEPVESRPQESNGTLKENADDFLRLTQELHNKPSKTGGRVSTTGPRVTPGKGSGTPGGRGSFGDFNTTMVAGETDATPLNAKEMKALERIQDERPSFSPDELKERPTLSADIESNRKDKITLIKNVRAQLKSAGLDFVDLKECEDLPSYDPIEKQIDALYEKIIKMSIKEKIDMKKMEKEIANALKSIKKIESQLALEYYQRELSSLSERVTGLNTGVVDSIDRSSKAMEKAFKKGTLTLKKAQNQVLELSKLIPPKEVPVKLIDQKQEKANAASRKKLEKSEAKGQKIKDQRALKKTDLVNTRINLETVKSKAERAKDAAALKAKYGLK